MEPQAEDAGGDEGGNDGSAGAAVLDGFRVAVMALIAERYADAAVALRRVDALDPGNDEVIYLIAMAAAHTRDRAAVLEALARLERMQSDLVPQDADLGELAGDPQVRRIAAAIAARAAAESRGVTEAFRIDEPGLGPEGIAYDPVRGAFFVGSTRKHEIVRVRGGKAAEFATEAAGLTSTLGLRVDAQRRELWAASEAPDGADGAAGAAGASSLTVFDADTGARKARYTPPTGGKHLLNDVTIAADGTAYVTDSEAGQVWALSRGGTALVAVVPPDRFVYPNGIAWDDAAKQLLVADAVTIWRIDPASGAVAALAAPRGVSLAGLDGMYVAGDRILGVQNLAGPGRVVAYALAHGRARVTERRVLAAIHPAFDAPTTGAISPDGFYLLANSQIHSARPAAPVIVLRVPMP